MRAELQKLFQRRADLLMSGRYDELAKQYSYPMVIFWNADRIIVNDQRKAMLLLADFRAEKTDRLVKRVQIKVCAVEPSNDERFVASCRLSDFSDEGALLRETAALQYCRKTPDGIRIEMSAFGQSALEDICNQSIAGDTLH